MLLIFAFLWTRGRKPQRQGQLFGMFAVLYAVERFIIEFVRAKGDRMLFDLTTSQVASLLLFGVGLWLLVRRRHAKPAPLGDHASPAPMASASHASPVDGTVKERSLAVSVRLPVALLLATACSTDAGRSRTGESEHTDSAGVDIVVNRGEGAWGGAPWTAREELSFGGDEALAPSVFGRIVDLDSDASGEIFVLDQPAREIRVFDVNGVFRRRIGGPGEGPGEFGRFPNSVLIVADTLFVTDWSLARITRFRLTGQVLRTDALPTTAGTRSWWQRSGPVVMGRELRRVTDERGNWRGIDVLLRPDGLPPRPDTLLTFSYTEADLGAPGRLRTPLIINTPAWTPLLDGGFAWTTLESSEVRIHDATGRLTRIIRRDTWIPRPVDDAAYDILVHRLGEKMTQLGAGPGVVENADLVRPANLPVLSAVLPGPDSTIWVQRTARPEEFDAMSLNAPENPQGFGGASWDVFAADGRLLGTVMLPLTVRIARILGDRIYGVHRDSLDVERVARLRVDR